MQHDQFYNKIYDMVEFYRNDRNVFFYTSKFEDYNFNFGSLPHHFQHDILMLGILYCEDIDIDEIFEDTSYSFHDFIKLAYDEGSNINPILHAAMVEKIVEILMPIILNTIKKVISEQNEDGSSMDNEILQLLHLDNQKRLLSIKEQL